MLCEKLNICVQESARQTLKRLVSLFTDFAFAHSYTWFFHSPWLIYFKLSLEGPFFFFSACQPTVFIRLHSWKLTCKFSKSKVYCCVFFCLCVVPYVCNWLCLRLSQKWRDREGRYPEAVRSRCNFHFWAVVYLLVPLLQRRLKEVRWYVSKSSDFFLYSFFCCCCCFNANRKIICWWQ